MLIDDYKHAIRAKNYSPKTFEAYWPHVVDLLRFCRVGGEWRRPEQLAEPEVTSFLTMLAVIRVNDCTRNRKKGRPAKAVTTKTERWKDFPDVCRRQGLEAPLQLPGWYQSAKVRAVANGVPLRMGRALAAAVALRAPRETAADCQCGCGRPVSDRALTATASCRKRKQLASQPKPWVDLDGYHDV